ncbi:cell death-inducing p53-target protein 1-like isoform X1, partial [Clarias magur]
MDSESKHQELERISTELHKLTLHREQLNSRLRLMTVLKEFRQNTGYTERVSESSEKEDCKKIEEELEELSERKLALQALRERLEGTLSTTLQIHDPLSNEIFTVEKPPPFTAPQVILDVEKLSREPSQTLCPFCEQYVTTEVSTVIGNATWLVCLASIFV